jgi:glycerol-3-phosphate dehydrogenase
MTPESLDPAEKTVSADLIVIGGGIFGLMLAYEAGIRGRKAILVEKNRIGGATTDNWFRILHGGLRYLQSLDFARTVESARERRWFLKFAPDLVRPLPFLMPLYGGGLKSPMALRGAFALEAALTYWRNDGVSEAVRLSRGRVLSPLETRSAFPDVRGDGLKGSALWNEVVVPDNHAMIGRLRAAAEAGGAAIREGCTVEALETAGGRVTGVAVSGAADAVLRAPVVVNAAGPWSADLAAQFGSPVPTLFRPALAFNLLLDRPPLSDLGLAVTGRSAAAKMLFLYPLGDKTFAGTWHCPWTGDGLEARAPEHEIDAFLAALADAAPTLGARREHVLQVFPGLQPARHEGTVEIAHRDVIVDHAEIGGPSGLISLSGIKYTTARHVASKVLDHIERARNWRGD